MSATPLQQMVTREDTAKLREEMAKMGTRLILWNMGSILAMAALTVAIVRVLG